MKTFTPSYDDEVRFWSRVSKSPEGCWTWTGASLKHGYGIFYCDGKSILTHRFSAKISGILVNDNLCVCHTCDRPSCVRPSHLFEGTRQQNTLDMFAKKRDLYSLGKKFRNHAKGEDASNHKLRTDEVVSIKKLFSLGGRTSSIARQYGVSQATISNIRHGDTWKHIDG